MNYLAHAYLSFNLPDILAGNLISDFVKGKKKFDYTPGVQKGIALHREIDNFTDRHPVIQQAKEIFRPHYRLYAGAFTDVVLDHFLAIDPNEFTEVSLLQFSTTTYEMMMPYLPELPEKFQQLFPYMQRQNWLNNYQHRWAIERSLAGVAKRAAYLSESAIAFSLFETHYGYLQDCYSRFFPALKKFAIEQLPVP